MQYQALVRELKRALPGKIIAMAVYHNPNDPRLELVAADQASNLDQINVMCYDMDFGQGASWYNDALMDNGNTNLTTCKGRVGTFTSPPYNILASKIGVGMPFYTRRWSGCTQALANGCTMITTPVVSYRDLSQDMNRWQPQYKHYDPNYKSNDLSIPG